MKRITLLVILIILIIVFGGAFLVWKCLNQKSIASVNSFEECEAQGYPVMESYPRRCKTPDNRTFTEDIGNALEKTDLIQVTEPLPNAVISSPLKIKGQARGFWFFEASFPVKLLDANGKEIATNPSYIQAQGEWMTTEFVSFEATIEFQKPGTKKGTLILRKDNPSGLPANDDELIIPISFGD